MSTISSLNPNLSIRIDNTPGLNNEHLITPMPDSVEGVRNTINAAAVTNCTGSTNVGAGGGAGAGNHIAAEATPAVGAGTGPALMQANWDEDDLSSDPTLNVITILGAYDQVCNSTGSSIVAAPHSMIRYSVGGHNNIAGGSTNLVSGTSTRSSIWGCTSTVIHNGSFTSAIGCQSVSLSGASFTHAVGCSGTITTATRSLLVGCAAQTISGVASLCVGDVTNSGSYGVVVGQTNTVTGSYGCTVGTGLTNAKSNAAVFGATGVALQDNSITLCGTQTAAKGDATWCVPVDGVSSTGTGATLSLIQFPDNCNVAMEVLISVIGRVVGQNKVIGFSRHFTVLINDDTVVLIDDSGTGTDLYRDPSRDNSGLTYSVGNAGKFRIAANAQAFRIVTPGFSDADTTVRWTGSASITLTREDTVT